jgi:hypothetical protein
MGDEQETGPSAAAGRSTVWLVLDTGRSGYSVSAFWQRVDATAHAAVLSAPNTGGRAVLREVVVQGGRRRCRLCGEPVVLDDPSDTESWRHADDANDLGDHTAEA